MRRRQQRCVAGVVVDPTHAFVCSRAVFRLDPAPPTQRQARQPASRDLTGRRHTYLFPTTCTTFSQDSFNSNYNCSNIRSLSAVPRSKYPPRLHHRKPLHCPGV